MARSKKHLRKIMRITASEATARTGNPRFWRLLLECGHVTHEHHSRRRTIHALVMEAPVKPVLKTHCYKCALGESPSFDDLQLGDLKALEGDVAKAAFKRWGMDNGPPG